MAGLVPWQDSDPGWQDAGSIRRIRFDSAQSTHAESPDARLIHCATDKFDFVYFLNTLLLAFVLLSSVSVVTDFIAFYLLPGGHCYVSSVAAALLQPLLRYFCHPVISCCTPLPA